MITIYGASDDCIETDIDGLADEFYAAHDGTWQADLVAPGDVEAMRVTLWYAEGGTWHAAIGQTHSDVPLPPWGNGTGQHPNGYSVYLRIDAPAGTRLENMVPGPQEGSGG